MSEVATVQRGGAARLQPALPQHVLARRLGREMSRWLGAKARSRRFRARSLATMFDETEAEFIRRAEKLGIEFESNPRRDPFWWIREQGTLRLVWSDLCDAVVELWDSVHSSGVKPE